MYMECELRIILNCVLEVIWIDKKCLLRIYIRSVRVLRVKVFL